MLKSTETASNRRNIGLHKEIWVNESNAGLLIGNRAHGCIVLNTIQPCARFPIKSPAFDSFTQIIVGPYCI